jgi:hypothetical protein
MAGHTPACLRIAGPVRFPAEVPVTKLTSLTKGVGLAALFAAGVLVVSVACGGSDSTDTRPATNGDSSSSSQPSSTSGSGTTTGVTTSELSSLESYRYTLKMEGTGNGGPLAEIREGLAMVPGTTTNGNDKLTFNVDGAYVKPDKAEFKARVGSFEVAQTVIGRQEWVTLEGRTMGPQPASSLNAADLSLAAAMWDQSNLPQDISDKAQCSSSKETVNGVSARKCQLDKSALASLQRDLDGFFQDVSLQDLSAFSMNLWLADQGYPVKLDVDMAGKDSGQRDYALKVQMDLTDINKSIDIKAPQ